ncbi:hypothetical protein CLLI_01330 [Clostridium liquoris]|jgi:hypothetical protein|uniref:Uncharacterized protein n=1 Tax=Clostridium liquoris TaxID=1289519 RepID=A0A2T0B9J9_9CLOT|nr:hypothetical protein CLLI_01330 [Clostridium liquoris]
MMIRKVKSFIEMSDKTTDEVYKFLECFSNMLKISMIQRF